MRLLGSAGRGCTAGTAACHGVLLAAPAFAPALGPRPLAPERWRGRLDAATLLAVGDVHLQDLEHALDGARRAVGAPEGRVGRTGGSVALHHSSSCDPPARAPRRRTRTAPPVITAKLRMTARRRAAPLPRHSLHLVLPRQLEAELAEHLGVERVPVVELLLHGVGGAARCAAAGSWREGKDLSADRGTATSAARSTPRPPSFARALPSPRPFLHLCAPVVVELHQLGEEVLHHLGHQHCVGRSASCCRT